MILSIPCTGPNQTHRLFHDADAPEPALMQCVWCDCWFRVSVDGGSLHLALDVMASTMPVVPAILQTNPAPALVREARRV